MATDTISEISKSRVGLRFGRLIITGFGGRQNSHQLFECKCDCGNTVRAMFSSLTRKKKSTKSCGCLNAEQIRTHGMTHTPEYDAWKQAIQRCTNPKSNQFKNYGGRGIKMCERWLNSFENFYADMGPQPAGTSLDRIDNNSDYSPDNCRWATPFEQQNNRRNNRLITHQGHTLSMSEWARKTGINRNTINSRIRLKWPIEKVLTTPTETDYKFTH